VKITPADEDEVVLLERCTRDELLAIVKTLIEKSCENREAVRPLVAHNKTKQLTTGKNKARFPITDFPGGVQEALSFWDTDGSGTISAAELAAGAKAAKNTRQQKRFLQFLVVALFIVVGIMSGVTYAIVDAQVATHTGKAGTTGKRGDAVLKDKATGQAVMVTSDAASVGRLDSSALFVAAAPLNLYPYLSTTALARIDFVNIKTTTADNIDQTLNFRVAGFTKIVDGNVTLHTMSGHTIEVSPNRSVVVTDNTGSIVHSEAGSGRRLNNVVPGSERRLNSVDCCPCETSAPTSAPTSASTSTSAPTFRNP